MSTEPKVTVECGTVDPHYSGVADPQLTPVYLQTPEEEARYAPIMQELRENGLPESGGGQISGI